MFWYPFMLFEYALIMKEILKRLRFSPKSSPSMISRIGLIMP